MSEIIIPYRVQHRRDTAANWAINGDDLLKEGEWGIEIDTGRAKIGDGSTPWRALEYVVEGFIDFTGLQNGSLLTWDAARGKWVVLNTDLRTTPIGATFDAGAGGVIAAGSECTVFVPYGFEILEWRVLTNTGVGAFEADVRVCDYAAHPPTAGDSITGGNEITIAPGDNKNADSVMTGWTKTFAAGGKIVLFRIITASGVQSAVIELIVRKS